MKEKKPSISLNDLRGEWEEKDWEVCGIYAGKLDANEWRI